MIVTLTLNPAVDQTVWADAVQLGAVNRTRQVQLDPAGKGINVSRMAHRLGWPTIAFGFLAGEIGGIVRRALDREGVAHHFVSAPGQTRINVTVVDDVSHLATSFYNPGLTIEREHLRQLDDLLRFWLPACRVFVLGGSLPLGVPEDVYADYIRLAASQGVRTILDSSGSALRLGVEAGPYLIKPNVREAEQLLGRTLPDVASVVEGARELARRGTAVVVVSMGSQGAVCVQGSRTWRVTVAAVERQSTVGPGDSFVAGLAVAMARGSEMGDALRLATAAGAATAATPGTMLGTAEEVTEFLPDVQVEEIE